MLAIRMKRTGRKGHAQFRLVVQDSRFSPSSGRVVAYLGSYDPHTKATTLDKNKAAKYLQNGARPSDSAASLLKKEGVNLPLWVHIPAPQKRTTRHPEKLRRNRPAEAVATEALPAEEPAPAEESPEESAAPESSSADEDPKPSAVPAEAEKTKGESAPK